MIETLQMLFDYNRWANHRVWDCVMALTDEQYHQPSDYSTGSVHDHCYHLMQIDGSALAYWMGQKIGPDHLDFIKAEDYKTRADIRVRWDRVEAAYSDFLSTLDDNALQREVKMSKERRTPLSYNLLTIVNHSTNHRAQILRLIHDMGGETCEQGLYFYLLEG